MWPGSKLLLEPGESQERRLGYLQIESESLLIMSSHDKNSETETIHFRRPRNWVCQY